MEKQGLQVEKQGLQVEKQGLEVEKQGLEVEKQSLEVEKPIGLGLKLQVGVLCGVVATAHQHSTAPAAAPVQNPPPPTFVRQLVPRHGQYECVGQAGACRGEVGAEGIMACHQVLPSLLQQLHAHRRTKLGKDGTRVVSYDS